jgi:succinylarginine dihydrolase
MAANEFNFDGLVGPTHNYAGLSYGNVASMKNRSRTSNPKQAALQGLEKMKFLYELGVRQAVLPPQERPHIPTLRAMGFTGTESDVLKRAHKTDPMLLAAVSSASSMWTANAATVSPGADTADGRVHLTPANLVSQFHRSIEPATTARVLRAIFHDRDAFYVHNPLPSVPHFGDEGAANFMRVCRHHHKPGYEIFVYGRAAFDASSGPRKFPARQTLESSAALVRRHGVRSDRALLLQQNPLAIDAGAFHNDVVAVANRNVLLYHSQAFARRDFEAKLIDWIGDWLVPIRVDPRRVPLKDAVSSYLFNSQLVDLPDGTMALIAPVECRINPRVRREIDRILNLDSPIRQVHFVDVRQSMRNGGGPACLRLRVVLSDAQASKLSGHVLFTPMLYSRLVAWIEKHYRDELSPGDLADPRLLQECRDALNELTTILLLPSVYDFQM